MKEIEGEGEIETIIEMIRKEYFTANWILSEIK